jgi:CRISPR/Cas system-associated exonuclease Cas4 (RecB family)
MTSSKSFLSKSRILSAWQCPKKLYLEKRHPELAEVSVQTESMFATGHQVGAAAQLLYGGDESIEIPFSCNTSRMLRETRDLLDSGANLPIFEATFQHEGVLVRVDVLLPERGGWRAIEVKASTSVKDYHVLDCAIQHWVMRHAGLPLTSMSLAHIDNQFIYDGDNDYDGLFVEVDITKKVRAIELTVPTLIERARDSISGSMPDIIVGAQCNKPYECQFINYCWPTNTDYPIAGLGGSKAKLGSYVANGWTDIRDVDAASITADTQLRIHRVTTSGIAEIRDDACKTLSALPYPRYYLDFETIAPAIPFWVGTRPYAPVPVQWSCHTDDGRGDGSYQRMRHEEFLDLSGAPPMRKLAEKLIRCLDDSGPVIMYTNYEEKIIGGLISLYPDLADPLQAIVYRLFDLHPVVKANYYHPAMRGSWSIKAVLPTVAPQMDYGILEGIQEGSAASNGFIEAISPDTTPQRKAELRQQLLRYCSFDTEAMAELVRFFSGHAS